MMGEVVVTYRLADIYGAMLHGWRRLARLLIVVELLWIVLIVGINLADDATFYEAIRWIDWKLLLIGGLVLIAFWFGLCPLLGYWRIKGAGVLGPSRFSLVDRGIRIESPKAESVVYWSGIRRTIQTSSRFYLFLVTTGAIIIPRRAFDSDAAYRAWIDEAMRRQAEAKPKA